MILFFLQAVLGVCFQIKAPALFEDIPLVEEDWKHHNYSMAYVHEKYEQVAVNCFIATGIYVIFFFFSCCQQRMNARASYEMS